MAEAPRGVLQLVKQAHCRAPAREGAAPPRRDSGPLSHRRRWAPATPTHGVVSESAVGAILPRDVGGQHLGAAADDQGPVGAAPGVTCATIEFTMNGLGT